MWAVFSETLEENPFWPLPAFGGFWDSLVCRCIISIYTSAFTGLASLLYLFLFYFLQ
jgi:hypothetical protein